jgi:hypothetical protein
MIGMEAHGRRTTPAWGGLALLFVGFLVFIVAYFVFPFVVVNGVFSCGDVCISPKLFSMWGLLQYQLAHFRSAPIGYTLALAVVCLPLLGGVVTVLCSLAYRVWARRAFVAWSTGALIAGSVGLFIMLLVSLVLGQPDWGYLGMLLGYGLLWAGSLLLRASPQAQVTA